MSYEKEHRLNRPQCCGNFCTIKAQTLQGSNPAALWLEDGMAGWSHIRATYPEGFQDLQATTLTTKVPITRLCGLDAVLGLTVLVSEVRCVSQEQALTAI
jgi:hypothetical protein